MTGELPTRNEDGRPSPQLPRWKVRALVEARIVPMPPAPLAALPAHAPTAADAVWALVGDLLAVRRLREPGETTLPLSIPFLTDWASWLPHLGPPTAQTVASGRKWLVRNGYLTDAGPCGPGRLGKPLKAWRVRMAAEERHAA
jgi:hypothetical protein